MDERCEITELLKSQCAHCLGHVPYDEEAEKELVAEIENFMRWAEND